MTLTRKTPMRRTGKIKPRNRKRQKAEFARCYHSDERCAFVRSLPCRGCGCEGGWSRDDTRVIVNAHTKGEGTSRKGHYTTIIPLCTALDLTGCHDLQHMHGWSALMRLDAPELRADSAAYVQELWLVHLAGGLPERTR